MFGGLNRPLAAAVIAGAFLLAPSAALASGCGSGTSAEQVYKECLQNGGGGKSTSGAKGSTPTNAGSAGVAVSPQVATKLKQAGKAGKALQHLHDTFGIRRHLASSHATAATEPTAIGSAFDLGSGPTVLLIVLAGTAVLLLGATGFRLTRHRP